MIPVVLLARVVKAELLPTLSVIVIDSFPSDDEDILV